MNPFNNQTDSIPCKITNSDHPALSSGELQKLTTKDLPRRSNRPTETTQNVSGKNDKDVSLILHQNIFRCCNTYFIV